VQTVRFRQLATDVSRSFDVSQGTASNEVGRSPLSRSYSIEIKDILSIHVRAKHRVLISSCPLISSEKKEIGSVEEALRSIFVNITCKNLISSDIMNLYSKNGRIEQSGGKSYAVSEIVRCLWTSFRMRHGKFCTSIGEFGEKNYNLNGFGHGL